MNIAVYCGSRFGNDDIYRIKAEELARWIASSGYNLVYGGSKVGLMGVIAKTVLDNSGKVIGVMPDFFVEEGLDDKTITELIIVENMSIRKKTMFDLSNVFIAMPGGAGTLEEITEVISWANIGKNDSPCIFYNVNGFYDDIYKQYRIMNEKGFFGIDGFNKILFSDNLNVINDFIKNYTPPKNIKF